MSSAYGCIRIPRRNPRTAVRKAKSSIPTREEILKGMGWEPLCLPGCPPKVVEAENRRRQDEIVAWVRGMSAHIEKCEHAQETARQSKASPKGRVASVEVEIDAASDVGSMMAELRRGIALADLAGKGAEAHPCITVRHGIVGGDLDGLRLYLRSLQPFEITFGELSFLPASVDNDSAATLKVDVLK